MTTTAQAIASAARMQVPFFRPDIGEEEIQEVLQVLRSGWLTTGARAKQFEAEFAAAVGGKYAVAVNSCTAALHLAVEAMGLKEGEAVLVPTMTFAATAEVVRYMGAIPVLVDCDPVTLNIDILDAEARLELAKTGELLPGVGPLKVVGIIPVHVAGLMLNIDVLRAFSKQHAIWCVEDAAHAFPAAWRRSSVDGWERCGEGTSRVACFSFYANKTITTGEGGMAVTEDETVANRVRRMSLHGLSHDAWALYTGGDSWDYRIVAPGFKYNLTDVAAALGIHQLHRAEEMRIAREKVANIYASELAGLEQLELPDAGVNRIHSWHLFVLRLVLERLTIDRNQFSKELKDAGIGCSVHWRPLHLHPYYEQEFGWKPQELPTATTVWPRLISVPIFPSMHDSEIEYVVDSIRAICRKFAK